MVSPVKFQYALLEINVYIKTSLKISFKGHRTTSTSFYTIRSNTYVWGDCLILNATKLNFIMKIHEFFLLRPFQNGPPLSYDC